MSVCICGCGIRSVHLHHVIYIQQLRRTPEKNATERRKLMRDPRNLVPVALGCHAAHHNTTRKLPLACLPDQVYAFAYWLMGPGLAYEYLTRRYQGDDPRADALLDEWERDAA